MPFLSQVLGRPIIDPDGMRVGTLRDLLVPAEVPYPPIRTIVVSSKKRLHAVPWSDVRSITPRDTALRYSFDPNAYPAPGDDLIWLARDVLDSQIVDTSGVKLVRVNDLALTPLDDELRLAGVDNSSTGLLRRLGLEWLASLFSRGRPPLIDWEQVDIGPAVDKVRLKVPFKRLRRMHPADIATVINQMSPGKAADVLEMLEDETAANAMVELSEEHQVAVLRAMEPEEAADVLEAMPPDKAADVLSDVGQQGADELMRLMEPQAAHEVRELLTYPEDTAGGLMNSRVVTVRDSDTAEDVIAQLRRTAPPEDEVWYIYVVGDTGVLRGVLSLRDLIIAQPSTQIMEIVQGDIEYVHLADSKEEVVRKLIRYNLLALPVVDDDGHLKGVVTVDDVVDLMAPQSWRNRPQRMLG